MRRRGFTVFVYAVLALLAVGFSDRASAAFPPEGLESAADAYVQGLIRSAPPDPKGDARALKARAAEREGDAAAARADHGEALRHYERAIGLGGVSHGLLMKLSGAWTGAAPPSPERALQTAWLASRVADKDTGRFALSLWRVADILEGVMDDPTGARDALIAIAARVSREKEAGAKALFPIQKRELLPRLTELRRRLGISVQRIEVDAERDQPRVCVWFDESLNTRGPERLEDFVAFDPAPTEVTVDGEGRRLCIGGIDHGSIHKLTLREGLPGHDGVVLKKAVTDTVLVPDRAASLAFRGGGRILPKVGPEGVPFTAINVDTVKVRIYRVGDRALVPFEQTEGFETETSSWRADDLAGRRGALVWDGTVTLKVTPNRPTVAAIPFAQAVPDPQPGYYAITIDARDVPEEAKPWGMATQWLQVTDIGVTSMDGADGIHVFTRSIATAKPMPGARVSLIANNNDELGHAVTDADGHAVFGAGLTKGEGGRAPHSIMVHTDGDFATQSLNAPAFDLSDRGVGGRMPPGPLDSFVYADRGVYRQGETVNISALVRDEKTVGVTDLPLTVKVLRPSGTEYLSRVERSAPGGIVTLPVALSETAPLGGWRVEVFADPNLPAIGFTRFQVEDFVPERLAVEAEPSGPWIGPEDGGPFTLNVRGRFLYGAPAAGLDGTAEMRVEADPNPHPDYRAYTFGLSGENVTAEVTALEFPTADADGLSQVPVNLGELPDVSVPMRARFAVTMMEPGGRPARAEVTVPVRRRPLDIGIKAENGAYRVKEGEAARFGIVTLDRDGGPVATKGLKWTLIRERADFQWFMEGGRYQYRATRHDETVASGTLTTGADGLASIDGGAKLLVGRYRVEVMAEAQGAISSRGFAVGWEPPDEPSDIPDALDVIADKSGYHDGDVARIKVTPPFAGELLVTVATDRVHWVRTLSIGAEGATVEVPVDAKAWGPGAYVTATVYRPPLESEKPQPVRAVGLAWLGIDTAFRTLDVTVEAPKVARPRGKTEIAIKVGRTDAAGSAPPNSVPDEPTYITLAAVDEGILRLTRFVSPDPTGHYFGKRRLGVDIRDDYGRLILAMKAMMAEMMRSGGDSSGAGLPALPFQLVSLFHGPVAVGADGVARVTLDIPDFSGELRLMAVAFSAHRMGASAIPMTVRDPLTAEAYTPRFLAPGDTGQLTLSLHNVDGAAGEYTAAVTAINGLSLPKEGATRAFTLAAGDRVGFTLPLSAGELEGVGHVALKVTGPGGFAVERGYDLTIRSPRPVERMFTVDRLAPGASGLLDLKPLDPYQAHTATLSASFGVTPPFDVAGILDALYRYPYGCVEQTISTAMPLLVLEPLEKAMGVASPDRDAAARLPAAIRSLFDRQRYDGSFPVWSARGEAQDWLTAYAGEFLVRARKAGHFTPEEPTRRLMKWLERHAVDGGTDDSSLASRAYALHVLTLAGGITASPVRYFHDAFVARLPTALSNAQLAVALARFGDKPRAAHAMERAMSLLKRRYWQADYGSTVRDAAAILRLLTEVGMDAPHREALLARLPPGETAASATSTQERAWLVLAAAALTDGAGEGGVSLNVKGATATGKSPVTVAPTTAQLAAGVTVINAGTAPLWRTVGVSGIPVAPPKALHEGFTFTRRFLHRDGSALDPATVAQNDVFVVELSGRAETGVDHQIMVTQPLPAGWEIERVLNDGDRGEGGGLDWLEALSELTMSEARDDRLNAAFDLGSEGDATKFHLAFLVRAVTPGEFELPGASVEDMYRPDFRARLPWTRTHVGQPR